MFNAKKFFSVLLTDLVVYGICVGIALKLDEGQTLKIALWLALPSLLASIVLFFNISNIKKYSLLIVAGLIFTTLAFSIAGSPDAMGAILLLQIFILVFIAFLVVHFLSVKIPRAFIFLILVVVAVLFYNLWSYTQINHETVAIDEIYNNLLPSNTNDLKIRNINSMVDYCNSLSGQKLRDGCFGIVYNYLSDDQTSYIAHPSYLDYPIDRSIKITPENLNRLCSNINPKNPSCLSQEHEWEKQAIFEGVMKLILSGTGKPDDCKQTIDADNLSDSRPIICFATAAVKFRDKSSCGRIFPLHREQDSISDRNSSIISACEQVAQVPLEQLNLSIKSNYQSNVCDKLFGNTRTNAWGWCLSFMILVRPEVFTPVSNKVESTSIVCPMPQYVSPLCPKVITKARNIKTGEVKEFSDGCLPLCWVGIK